MIVTFVDVEDPGINVYQDVVQIGSSHIEPGQVWDFGLPEDNSMAGAWKILSLERPWKDGSPDAENIRVNIQRVEVDDADGK